MTKSKHLHNRYTLNNKSANQWAADLGISLTALLKRIKRNGGIFDESCLVKKSRYIRGVQGGKNKQMSRIGFRWSKTQQEGTRKCTT